MKSSEIVECAAKTQVETLIAADTKLQGAIENFKTQLSKQLSVIKLTDILYPESASSRTSPVFTLLPPPYETNKNYSKIFCKSIQQPSNRGSTWFSF